MAQESSESYKSNNYFDLTAGTGTKQFAGTLSWYHLHGIGEKKKFKAGYGARFTSFNGKNQIYTTAPAKLIVDNLIDTLTVNSPQSNSLNASIQFQYQIIDKLAAGFNIDAIGFGFGKTQNAEFVSTESGTKISSQQNAVPTKVNMLLVGNNDIGQLNSEFYLSYFINDKFSIRGGMSLLFSEYTTTNILLNNNDRFRNKAGLVFLGISYKTK